MVGSLGSLYGETRIVGDGATYCEQGAKTRPPSAQVHPPDENAQSINVVAIFVGDRDTLVVRERLGGRKRHTSFAMSVPSRSSVRRAPRRRACDPRALPREKLHEIDFPRSEQREERDGPRNKS